MINEYLFLSDEYRKEISEYVPDNITVEFSSIKNTSLWIVSYSLASKSEDSAKKLSDVHSFIMKYSPLTLSCESSEYFNKALFPLANEFERKLRKLLYLSASISNSKEAQKTINDLESKTLGIIFESLFVDQAFVVNVKKRMNGQGEFNGRGNYSKTEIQDFLANLEENTLWNSLFPSSSMPTIKARYTDVFEYRNSVMHAHNIDKKLFSKAKYLFSKANEEIDIEIGKRIGQVEEKPNDVRKDVNSSISSALTSINLSGDITPSTTIAALSLPSNIESSATLSAISRDLKGIQLDATIKRYIQELDRQINPEILNQIREEQNRFRDALKLDPVVLKQVEALIKKFDATTMRQIKEMQIQIDSAIKPLQNQLRSIAAVLPEYNSLSPTIKTDIDDNDCTEHNESPDE